MGHPNGRHREGERCRERLRKTRGGEEGRPCRMAVPGRRGALERGGGKDQLQVSPESPLGDRPPGG